MYVYSKISQGLDYIDLVLLIPQADILHQGILRDRVHHHEIGNALSFIAVIHDETG